MTGLAVRLLSVIALLFISFAHKPINFTVPLNMAAYMLPDGSYPVICRDSDDHSAHDSGAHFKPDSCDACRLSSSVICPAPQPSTGAAPHIAVAHAPVPPQPVLWRDIYPPSAPPQAPPLA